MDTTIRNDLDACGFGLHRAYIKKLYSFLINRQRELFDKMYVDTDSIPFHSLRNTEIQCEKTLLENKKELEVFREKIGTASDLDLLLKKIKRFEDAVRDIAGDGCITCMLSKIEPDGWVLHRTCEYLELGNAGEPRRVPPKEDTTNGELNEFFRFPDCPLKEWIRDEVPDGAN